MYYGVIDEWKLIYMLLNDVNAVNYCKYCKMRVTLNDVTWCTMDIQFFFSIIRITRNSFYGWIFIGDQAMYREIKMFYPCWNVDPCETSLKQIPSRPHHFVRSRQDWNYEFPISNSVFSVEWILCEL